MLTLKKVLTLVDPGIGHGVATEASFTHFRCLCRRLHSSADLCRTSDRDTARVAFARC